MRAYLHRVSDRTRLLMLAALTVVAVLALPAAALAQEMPAGSGYECGDGTTSVTCYDTIGDTFSKSIDDFGALVVDLAPFLFGGLITVLLIRLAIKWFRRVAKSV